MKIALAQINPTVGDLDGNFVKISRYVEMAREENVNLIIFPELVVVGYPPKDLLAKRTFLQKNKEIVEKVAELSKDIAVILGCVVEIDEKLYNSAAFMEDSVIQHIYHKQYLPNYDVFDEKRYFTPGTTNKVIAWNGINIGLNICEDIWIDNGPMKEQCLKGADLIINISGSPFHAGKEKQRETLLAIRAKENNTPVMYVNLVGAQDDLIFDGRSYVFNESGEMVAKAGAFIEDLLTVEFPLVAKSDVKNEEEIENVYKALVLGVKDYFRKNGFSKAIIGLSGGIDSALTAAIAVKALGKDNVVGISMPSLFSSAGSIDDSQKLAENLGIKFHVVPINNIYDRYLRTLDPHFAGTEFNVAEENIQARVRGNLLMAMSNKFGYLVLATGNKSELSIGYATLYGDMAGGLAVISDVLKGTVYKLSEFINENREIIPQEIILKEPSAELREDQKDSDSLPPYSILDAILQAYVEEDKSQEEIITMGFEEQTVTKVIRMVDRNEYKRQQAALGLKITSRAFGSGRRMPITNKWIG